MLKQEIPKRVSFTENVELEAWIKLNECEGKPGVLKTLRPEPEMKGFFYSLRVEGVRYNQFGVYEEKDEWYVVHKSGRLAELSYSTENAARRMVYLLRKLTDWRKIDWSDDKEYLKSPWLRICREAYEYCNEVPGCQIVNLLKMVRLAFPKTEEEIVDDFVYQSQVVPFGDD